MSYTVLARRYRSAGFDQVVGQEPIAHTLKNAISCGRVAHAYLFTGTRGVGKTSMARILACALNAPDCVANCPKLPGKHEYPPVDAQRRMAEAIRRGDDLNVIEIDGASNRSVEEARQLIANAGLAPTGNARFKIYIIDEVHMLTREAFNALLKTMEEPPQHVKFILCTTEAHKVPATIQSRCQRFDFRNIPTAAIAEHVTSVLGEEKIDADKQVIWQIARLGNGSMRDALSLLDRLIAASFTAPTGPSDADPPSPNRLTMAVLEQILGLPDQDRIAALIDALAHGDVAKALQQTAALLDGGIAQDQLIDVLIEYLRQLMLIAACGPESELVDLSDDARVTAIRQSKAFDTAGLVYLIALCENLQRSSKTSTHPRALFDAVVVRLALADKMADVTALLAQSAATVIPAGPRQLASRSTSVEPGDKKKITAKDLPVTGLANNPTGVWTALLAKISDKPAMSWAGNLELVRIDQNTAHVAARPGHRDLLAFVNAHRRQQLAQLIEPILGKPVQVELIVTPRAEAGDSLPQAQTLSPHPASATTASRRSPDQALGARAKALPLVKQVQQVFDATLMDVRLQAPTTPDTDDTTAPGDDESNPTTDV